MRRRLTLADLREAEAWARAVHASAPPTLLGDWYQFHQERVGPDVPLLSPHDHEQPPMASAEPGTTSHQGP